MHDRPIVQRAALAAMLAVLLGSTSASAQARVELGTLVVNAAHPAGPRFFLSAPVPPPEPAARELPAAARAPMAASARARADLRAAHAELTQARDEATRTRLRERLAALDRTSTQERDRLLAALEAARTSLTPAARLLRGWLLFERAARAQLDALDRLEQCADCPEPVLDARAAAVALGELTGDDAVAGHAAVARGYVLAQMHEDEAAVAAYRVALANPALPEGVTARVSLALADLLEGSDAAAALEAYTRAASAMDAEVAMPAGYRGAWLAFVSGRPAEALALLARVLGAGADPELAADAHALAGLVVARGGADAAARVPGSLPPALRGAVLVAGARALADEGLRTWARRVLAASDALSLEQATATLRDGLRARLDAAPADSPSQWLRRAVTWCTKELSPQQPVRFALVARAGRTGTMRVTVSGAEALDARVVTCLQRAAPPPESPMPREVRALVEFRVE